jgi:hypothetical protein
MRDAGWPAGHVLRDGVWNGHLAICFQVSENFLYCQSSITNYILSHIRLRS